MTPDPRGEAALEAALSQIPALDALPRSHRFAAPSGQCSGCGVSFLDVTALLCAGRPA